MNIFQDYLINALQQNGNYKSLKEFQNPLIIMIINYNYNNSYNILDALPLNIFSEDPGNLCKVYVKGL